MPRILRILNRLAVGGPVLNATYLTHYMAPAYETLLVVGEKEDHEQSATHITDRLGIEYTTIAGMGRSLSPSSDYGAYTDLKKLIRSYKPDVVHTHAAKPGALGRLAAAACGVPAIVHTFHGHVFHSYFSPLKTRFFLETERYLARKSHAIVAISPEQKRELVEDFRIAPAEKFRLVPLGFDLDRFATDQEEKRATFRSEFGLTDDVVAIGITGRLVPIKNHSLFLQGLHRVLSGTKQPVKAFIIGGGDARESIEEEARRLGIPFTTERDTVHPHPLVFTSWRTDIDTINAGLDIICLTSLNEGTPVSLIEAQAAGKPVVSTRVGGIADVVEDGMTGILVPHGDADALGAALLRLVENGEERRRMGSGGGESMRRRYGYQRLVRDVTQLYDELLSR